MGPHCPHQNKRDIIGPTYHKADKNSTIVEIQSCYFILNNKCFYAIINISDISSHRMSGFSKRFLIQYRQTGGMKNGLDNGEAKSY